MKFQKMDIDRDISLLGTEEGENAFHNLIEMPKTIVKVLIEKYGEQENQEIRSEIIEVIGHYRDPESISFMISQMHSDDDVIWKKSLDALVSTGGTKTIVELRRIVTSIEIEKRAWIVEAIQQLEEREQSA